MAALVAALVHTLKMITNLERIMFTKISQTRLLIIASLAAVLCLPLTVHSASSEADDIMERYEQEKREAEAQREEEKRLRKLDQKQVVEKWSKYVFPLQESRCEGFTVDWNQITTVQVYVQTSLAHAKQLGNCLHAETKANLESLASDLEKANVGKTQWSWSGQGMPDSIDSIGTFAKFSPNYDRCNSLCWKLFNDLTDKAAAISMVKRDEFMSQWDHYTENNIKPAMKAQDPAGYEKNNIEQEFANIRSALKHFAFQRNAADQ